MPESGIDNSGNHEEGNDEDSKEDGPEAIVVGVAEHATESAGRSLPS